MARAWLVMGELLRKDMRFLGNKCLTVAQICQGLSQPPGSHSLPGLAEQVNFSLP